MNKVLVINASLSPLDNSDSWAMSKFFVEEYKKINLADQIIYLDLNNEEIGLNPLTSKNSETFWNEKATSSYIKILKDIDKIVLNFPMVNQTILSILKNFFDHIIVANETFTYKGSTNGHPIGLLNHLKIQILNTKGGTDTTNTHTIDYVKHVVTYFLGSTISENVVINEMMDIPPFSEQTPIQNLEKVKDELIAAAKKF